MDRCHAPSSESAHLNRHLVQDPRQLLVAQSLDLAPHPLHPAAHTRRAAHRPALQREPPPHRLSPSLAVRSPTRAAPRESSCSSTVLSSRKIPRDADPNVCRVRAKYFSEPVSRPDDGGNGFAAVQEAAQLQALSAAGRLPRKLRLFLRCSGRYPASEAEDRVVVLRSRAGAVGCGEGPRSEPQRGHQRARALRGRQVSREVPASLQARPRRHLAQPLQVPCLLAF